MPERVYSLSEWEPNGPCWIHVDGDCVKVELVLAEDKKPLKWKTLPPFENEEFDATKNYRIWSPEIF